MEKNIHESKYAPALGVYDWEAPHLIKDTNGASNKYINEKLALFKNSVYNKYPKTIRVDDIFTISLMENNNLTHEIFQAINKFTRVNFFENTNYALINKLCDDILVLKISDDYVRNQFHGLQDEEICTYFSVYEEIKKFGTGFAIDNEKNADKIKFPQKLIILELGNRFNEKLDNLPKSLKKLSIMNDLYENDIYLPENIEKFECYSPNKYNIYTQAKNSEHRTGTIHNNFVVDVPTLERGLFHKASKLASMNNHASTKSSPEREWDVPINKFPEFLHEIVYGGKQITLPKNIESFFYCGTDSYDITGKMLKKLSLIVKNKEQKINMFDVHEYCSITVYINNDINANNPNPNPNPGIAPNQMFGLNLLNNTVNVVEYSNIIFPERIYILKIINKQSQNIKISSKYIEELYVGEEYMNHNIISCNVKLLSLFSGNHDPLHFIKTITKNNSIFYLPNSLETLEIEKYRINYSAKEHIDVELKENTSNRMFDKNIRKYDNKLCNLPSKIGKLFVNPQKYTKKIRIPHKVTLLVLSKKFCIINKLPKSVVEKIMHLSAINKQNNTSYCDANSLNNNLSIINQMFERDEKDITMLRDLIRIETLKPDDEINQEYIDKLGDDLNELEEAIKNNERVPQKNRVKRNLNLTKLSYEEHKNIVNKEIKLFIEETSKNTDFVDCVKFNYKILKQNIRIEELKASKV